MTATTAPATGGSSGLRSLARQLRRWSGWLLIAGILLAWEAWTLLANVPPYLLPAPSRIVGAMAGASGTISRELAVTLFEALAGFAVGSIVAIVLAVAVLRSRTFEATALALRKSILREDLDRVLATLPAFAAEFWSTPGIDPATLGPRIV